MRRIGLLLAALGALCAPPAAAINVDFNGTVLNTCTVVLSTDGIMTLSADGEVLGTNQLGLAAPALVTVLSLGANTIDLSPVDLVTAPDDYDEGAQTIDLWTTGALAAVGDALGLSTVVGLLPLNDLFIHLAVTNPSGFRQGSYTFRTVLTCS